MTWLNSFQALAAVRRAPALQRKRVSTREWSHLLVAKGAHRVLAGRRPFGASAVPGRTATTALIPSLAGGAVAVNALPVPPKLGSPLVAQDA
jgi:hypothetical protein